MLGTTVSRGWYLKGAIPTVGSAPGKEGIMLSGFADLTSGQTVMQSSKKFDYSVTIASIRDFMNRHPRIPGRHEYMILDNAPWHRKAKRLIMDPQNEEYADIRERITFLDMPPYSPDLNPIEQLWRKTRKEVTHNRYFKTVGELWNALSNFYSQFIVPNETITKLCSFDFSKKTKREEKRIRVGFDIHPDMLAENCENIIAKI